MNEKTIDDIIVEIEKYENPRPEWVVAQLREIIKKQQDKMQDLEYRINNLERVNTYGKDYE